MDGGRGQEDDEAFMSGGRRYGSGRTRRAVPLETMRKVQELGEVEVERGGRERKRVKGPGIDEVKILDYHQCGESTFQTQHS